MTRPDDRPLKRLPTLGARKATLEKCVFCPKLCRSACPVSNAEERETLTPWGKMSMAYFVANESVALAESFAAPAWACTGCFGCRESCDHKNDVAGTLFEARSALAENSVAPKAAVEAIARHDEKSAVLGKTTRDLAVMPEVDPSAKVAVLLGCAYARAAKSPDSPARDAVRALSALEGGKVALVEQCCGAPLLYAGLTSRFHEHGRALAATLKEKKHERLVVVDAGCAAAIRVHHANAGIGMGVLVEHFTERAARELGRLSHVRGLDDGAMRWHDPCQLGRGLGVYDAPRALLSRALGRAPDEFDRRREDARCSGAGGLLPLTMPGTSRAIARKRVDEHLSAGGGTIVTGCASSRTTFEKQGAKTIDLVTVVARALGVAGPSGE